MKRFGMKLAAAAAAAVMMFSMQASASDSVSEVLSGLGSLAGALVGNSRSDDNTDAGEAAESGWLLGNDGENTETELSQDSTGSAQQNTVSSKTAAADGTYNLLIIGSDRRDDSWNGNSDSIILITINHNVKKLFMVSFMRDLWADIPGYGVHKINYSYAGGGAEKLIDTLESNFGVHIDNYVSVDWEAMVDIVDAFGGVDLDIHDYEVNATNGMIDYYCSLHSGLYAGDHYVSTGWQHLDGIAALNYSRVRFVGNNDYERTERQRKVLTCLLNNLDISDMDALMKLATKLLGETEHDLSAPDILTLAGEAVELNEYELVTDRIPYDDLYSSQNGMLVPAQPATNDRLHAEIYAK